MDNEDVKILEEFIEEYNASYPKEEEWVVIYPNQIQAIENLIARYKELKEENKRLKIELEIKKYCKVNELTEDLIYYKNLAKEYQGSSIPKSKVQEKIQKYNEIIYYAQTEEGMAELKDFEYEEAKYGIQILAELIED